MATQRASKKQQELFDFVKEFIVANSYGPSYREIMRALGYKSVSTVAVHIDQLIAKGYLEKTGYSARSLIVSNTTQQLTAPPASGAVIAYLQKMIHDDLADDDKATLQAAIKVIQQHEA